MPENVNTTVLDQQSEFELDDTRETMIKVENVSMVFNMASEQLNSLKEYAINIAKRKLSFKGFTAVDNVSFEVKKGDVFGIVGTNGSGKSTLLKIIAGVLEPTKGTCTINGRIAPLIELGAGFDLELTARENIFLNGALLGYPKAFINEHFDEIVSFAEIEKFLDMPMKNYSSGMVARIAFAIATVIIPEILVVDEVLSVGDFMFQKKCEDRISELIETHGVTVLIVSHNNDQIARLCNKALWIEKSHTRMMDDAAKVCRIYSALGGRVGDQQSEQRVFAALQDETEIPEDLSSIIAGDDSYGTNARAASKIWDGIRIPILPVAFGATHINTLLANSFAGALDAPILQVKADFIPDAAERLLAEYQPEKILFFDCWQNSNEVLSQLKDLKWHPEVIRITEAEDVFDISLEVLKYGKDNNLLAHGTAVLLDFEDNPESLVSMPFVYDKKCPVICTYGGKAIDKEAFANILAEYEVEELFIFGNTVDRTIDDFARKHEVTVTRFAKDKAQETCFDIAQWLFERDSGQEPEELCMASFTLSQWQDILMGGPYCAKRNSALLLEDPTDLNSIAACLDFVAAQKHRIKKLTFFGGDSNLSTLDKELLCRELM